MKTLQLTPKEYMLMSTLALQYGYTFVHSYADKLIIVEIAEEFCDAFGF
jgi:hypothetical protein